MLSEKTSVLIDEIVEGTGAAVKISQGGNGGRTALLIWFSDLGRTRSPTVKLEPRGLRRLSATLTFGSFAGETIRQIRQANEEAVQLARALVSTIKEVAHLSFSGGQDCTNWVVTGPEFVITAEKRRLPDRFGAGDLVATCRELVIPILAAMAELYGYDEIEEDDSEGGAMEGAVRVSVIRRRERNKRNRLLCLRLHGNCCKVCGMSPEKVYGQAGAIIEVHHLQPISVAGTPRAYDPRTDLIPLCPSCHRATHTRRPVPWNPDELSSLMDRCDQTP